MDVESASKILLPNVFFSTDAEGDTNGWQKKLHEEIEDLESGNSTI
jgi:hypothetical protein